MFRAFLLIGPAIVILIANPLHAAVRRPWVTTDRTVDCSSYESIARDVLTPGLNAWAAPSDRVMLTAGWSFNKVKSDANLCPPIFDG